jgi:hypothetical protein
MTLPELRKLCVDAFPLSTRRDQLMRSVEGLCTAVSTALILSEVWVDGSFLTLKIDPQDVDLVVVAAGSVLPGTPQQSIVLRRIAARDFTTPLPCDSYVIFEYPSGHPNYSIYELMRAYWIRQFCFNRKDEMKGLAVIRTPIS